jgi:hypothetical protein
MSFTLSSSRPRKHTIPWYNKWKVQHFTRPWYNLCGIIRICWCNNFKAPNNVAFWAAIRYRKTHPSKSMVQLDACDPVNDSVMETPRENVFPFFPLFLGGFSWPCKALYWLTQLGEAKHPRISRPTLWRNWDWSGTPHRRPFFLFDQDNKCRKGMQSCDGAKICLAKACQCH